MDALTDAMYDRLTGDATLIAMLAAWQGAPAVFTVDPVPPDATLPYIVTAGQVADAAFDTKTTRGRMVMRDVRCYAAADGSTLIEVLAERVRALLHRHRLEIAGYDTLVAECMGPIAANEAEAYGRVVTVRLTVVDARDGS